MDEKRIKEIEDHITAARQEVYDLAHGKQWRMCIPVQHGDSDIVFGVLIDDIQWLVSQLRKGERHNK